jgi:hypothetical protein
MPAEQAREMLASRDGQDSPSIRNAVNG